MPTPDLSDRDKLSFYDLLCLLVDETGKPFPDWLHLLAISACTEDEPQAVTTVPPLMLRPDETWGLTERKTVQRYVKENSFIAQTFDRQPQRTLTDLEIQEQVSWTLMGSAFQYFIAEPQGIDEPKGLKRSFGSEGVKVCRDDFRNWCKAAGYPLPRFWFGEMTQEYSTENQTEDIYQNLESRLLGIVIRLFWSVPPPEGHSRPTKELIAGWLLEGYEKEGLTPKAAARIITMSWPDNIPKHGNISKKLTAFPVPSYP